MRALAVLLVLAACAPVPEVATIPGGPQPPAGYPTLEPIDPILSRLARRDAEGPADGEALLAEATALRRTALPRTTAAPRPDQIDALRARAAILRGDASDIDALRARLAGATGG